MAIGGDQGGSIRMPSSFSGTYGMKPTWGLVPYTGVMPVEMLIDHTGPMTANCRRQCAAAPRVRADDDGYDPRIKSPEVKPYTKALGQGVKGMKIAVVREGCEAGTRGEAAVNRSVRRSRRSGSPRLGAIGRRDLDPLSIWSAPAICGRRSAPRASTRP